MAKTRKAEIEIRKRAGSESAYIADTRVRVSDIARLYPQLLDELMVERIVRSLPTLNHDQVWSALAYWREHASEIDAEIRNETSILAAMSDEEAFHSSAMNAFAEDWESKEDAIYDDILEDAKLR